MRLEFGVTLTPAQCNATLAVLEKSPSPGLDDLRGVLARDQRDRL